MSGTIRTPATMSNKDAKSLIGLLASNASILRWQRWVFFKNQKNFPIPKN